jgi:hypothetical protein
MRRKTSLPRYKNSSSLLLVFDGCNTLTIIEQMICRNGGPSAGFDRFIANDGRRIARLANRLRVEIKGFSWDRVQYWQ